MSTLLFHHIPKTAGRTFYEIIERQYRNKSIFKTEPGNELLSIENFKKVDASKRENYDLVYGHLALSLKEYINKNAKVCVFVRNPLNQAISSYLHIRRTKFNQFYETVKKMNNIIEYINWLPTVQFDNLQTRHLSESYFYLNSLDNTTENKNLQLKYFDLAKEQINKIDYVLLTEHFEESLFYLKRELKWGRHIYYKRENVSREKINTDINIIDEELRKINKYDYKLYEAAKIKFKENVYPLRKRNILENTMNVFYQISKKE